MAQVLRPLATHIHPNLLVGLQTSDDAAVYLVAPGVGIVQTLDFFTPIVDDPWTYGAIAAANSMSDVYAMGGSVLMALNIAGFPEDLPPAIVTEIFRGASDKVTEAGAVIGGGHTVTDPEPKFGLSVMGRIDPDRILTKAGLLPGDVLYLTKALGTGVIATAVKQGIADPSHARAAESSMLQLNRDASDAAIAVPTIRSCTDITGFGFLGHAWEMADRSGVRLQVNASALPLLAGSSDYAKRGAIAGGLLRNQAYFETRGPITFSPEVDPVIRQLMFDPQTSGGLLIGVHEDSTPRLEAELASRGIPVHAVGHVDHGTGIHVGP